MDHPLVTGKMEEIIKKCGECSKAVGTFVENAGDARRWIKLGVRYISFSVDMGIFYNACSRIIQDMNL